MAEHQVDAIAPAKTVSHALYPVPQGRKKQLMLTTLEQTATGRVLVFCRTKHRARGLARDLRRADDIDGLVRRQAGILDALWPLLSPGGRLLYVTCSLLPVENAQQIDGFAHYQPAVAIHGLYAHVVWVREDIEGAAKGNNRISYSRCRLDTGVCTSPVGVSPEGAAYSRLAPDVAVDDDREHVIGDAEIGRASCRERV